MLSISTIVVCVVSSQYGQSALMEAASWGGGEVVSLLVKAGAALDLQDEVTDSINAVLLRPTICCYTGHIVRLFLIFTEGRISCDGGHSL